MGEKDQLNNVNLILRIMSGINYKLDDGWEIEKREVVGAKDCEK